MKVFGRKIGIIVASSASLEAGQETLNTPLEAINFLYTGDFTSSLESGSLASIDAVISNTSSDGASGELLFRLSDPTNLSTSGSTILRMFHTGSNSEPRIGIGVDKNQEVRSLLDLRSPTGSSPVNIILRTNEDGVIEVGEETGRISFVIESSSYLGTELVASGSTAAIYSKVEGSSAAGAYGSLVFEVNDNLSVTEPVEALKLGYGADTEFSGVGALLSGSMLMTATAPLLRLKNSSTGDPLVRLGYHRPGTDLNDAQLLLYNQGNESVKFNGDASPADASFIRYGNFALGTTTAPEKLTVEGNISASGNLFVSTSDAAGASYNTLMVNTATGQFFHTGSYGGGGGSGTSGTSGSSGSSGTSGSSGSSGTSGSSGSSGTSGSSGSSGTSGSSGSSGTSGSSGSSGTSGSSGSSGTSGSSGSSGTSGLSGSSGTSGSSGSSGTSGSSGSSGTSGSSGSSGTSGSSGSSGTSGSSGSSGTSGSSGSSGTSGSSGSSGTSFVGSITGTTSNGLLTYVNATNNLAVESNLTFDGTGLDITGDITASNAQLTTIAGPSDQLVELGNYPVGYDVVSAFPVTGSGIIVSASTLASNHYNMIKVGDIELVDLKSLINPNTFLIHNVDQFSITSGSDSGDIASANYLMTHTGQSFVVHNDGSNMLSITNGAVSFTSNTSQFTVQPTSGDINLLPFSGDIYIRANNEQTTTTSSLHSVPVFATDPSTTNGGFVKYLTASAFLPKFQVNGGTFLGQTAQRALPFGSTTGESTLFTYTTTYMIPTKCTLLKVHTMSQANAGNLTLKAYTIPATTADNTAISNGTLIKSVTVASHDAGDPFEFDFNTGSFEAGTKFGLTVESDTNPNGFRFTAFFREDL